MISGQIAELGEKVLDEHEQEWLFTFGHGQPNANTFVRIFGTALSARKEMFKRYGKKWSFQYPASEEQNLKRNFIFELKE